MQCDDVHIKQYGRVRIGAIKTLLDYDCQI